MIESKFKAELSNNEYEYYSEDELIASEICRRLEICSSDNEIALEMNVEISNVIAVRTKIIHKQISDNYDYPIVFDKELIRQRVYQCLENQSMNNEGIANWIGIPLETVIYYRNKYKRNFNDGTI